MDCLLITDLPLLILDTESAGRTTISTSDFLMYIRVMVAMEMDNGQSLYAGFRLLEYLTVIVISQVDTLVYL